MDVNDERSPGNPATDDRPMRIGVIMEGLRADGGAESLLLTFAEHIDGTPHELDLFFLKPLLPETEQDLRDRNLSFTVHYARRMIDVRRLLRLTRDLRRVDVVQTNLVGPNVIGSVAARLAGKGSVAVLHNEISNSDSHLYHGRAERLALRHLAARVIAVGPRTQEARQKLTPDVDIHVLPNAVASEPPLDPAERNRLRSELMSNPGGHLILNVGRLEPQKAQTNLISAMPTILESIPDAELIIAGDGERRDELEALVDELGLVDRVHLIGTRGDIRRVMAASDLFALPSAWEGLPVALLEAMDAELPVLAAAVGDVPSVIGDGAGWLIDDNSPETIAAATVDVLMDPHRIDRIKRAKDLIAERYDADGWANSMLDHLRAARASREQPAGRLRDRG